MRHVTIQHKNKEFSLDVPDAAAWQRVIAEVIPLLEPGVIIALSGELGAGKTTFVQALAQELHISKIPQSPTFALIRTYPIPKAVSGVSRLIHVDAYRIDDEKDLVPLDLDHELGDGKSVLVLEWPEKIPQWITRHSAQVIRIMIER